MHTQRITPADPLFNRLSWAGLAVYKGEDRARKPPPGLEYLKIESERIIGCDGYRIHISNGSHRLTPGLWKLDSANKQTVNISLVTALKPEDMYITELYPDIDSIFPHVDAEILDIPDNGETYPVTLARYNRALPDAAYAVEPQYFEDMISATPCMRGAYLPTSILPAVFFSEDGANLGLLMHTRTEG